jgi:O-antigen/teichoic acid export membrane protein
VTMAGQMEGSETPYGGRFDLGGRGLREHTVRGAVINGLFQVGFVGIGFVRNFAVAAFLTASEFGYWTLVLTTVLTIAWLKQVGIGDKYVQQEEADQELAFQKAFTLELAWSAIWYVVIAAALPLYALLYGQEGIIVPGLVLSLALLAHALESPIWIAYRQMRFVRQRSLEAVDPIVSTILVIGLAALGYGYWALVIGLTAGMVAGAVVAVATSPYKLRLRYDRGTLREYYRFSWPLVLTSATSLVTVQGIIIVGNATVGLAGLGAIGLAGQIARLTDQVDGILGRTIYPAICAVQDRLELLFEAFEKSNRLALMWGLPFGVGLALFADELVEYVLGSTWEPAVPLIATFGVIFGLRQVAFNWTLLYSARGITRPIAVEGFAIFIVFAVCTVPLLITAGLTGYAIGCAVTVAVQLGVRAFYLRRLFRHFRFIRHVAKAAAPTAIAAAVVLAVRLAVPAAESPAWTVAELLLYAVAVVAATYLFERPLIGEIMGGLRGRVGTRPGPGEPAAA